MVRLAIAALVEGNLGLKTYQSLAEEFHKLIASYRSGLTDLAHLSQRSETLIEAMCPNLTTDTFSQAMNCVYLIEDVNALVLDEGRRVTDTEQSEINAQLKALEHFLLQTQ